MSRQSEALEAKPRKRKCPKCHKEFSYYLNKEQIKRAKGGVIVCPFCNKQTDTVQYMESFI